MAIVTVVFDGKPVKLDPKSLRDLLQSSTNLEFIFGGSLAGYLGQPAFVCAPEDVCESDAERGKSILATGRQPGQVFAQGQRAIHDVHSAA